MYFMSFRLNTNFVKHSRILLYIIIQISRKENPEEEIFGLGGLSNLKMFWGSYLPLKNNVFSLFLHNCVFSNHYSI